MSRTLDDAARQIELALDMIVDPVERMAAADRVRADLAVILTRSVRRSAYEAKHQGRLDDLTAVQWRGRDYLLKLAKQHADEAGLPNTHVRDIVTRRILDLTDLARLRGSSR
jgi:hypothetical protein